MHRLIRLSTKLTYIGLAAAALAVQLLHSAPPAIGIAGPDLPATTRPMVSAQRDTLADTWAATDALGRVLPGAIECGPPRPGKFVGIFYFLWMVDRPGPRVINISKLLAADPLHPQWGRPGDFHWWGQPHLGYYASNDEFVIRRHAQMLSDAGVDVMICDVTNAFTYDDTVRTIFNVFTQMRREGNRTPQVAFISYARSAATVRHLYETIYAPNVSPELWFRWKGKPLLLTPDEGLTDELRRFFTIRQSWAWTGSKGWFGDGKDRWPWLDHTPQKPGWHERPDKPEAISVAVAEHPTGNIGRSFHAGHEPPAVATHPEQGIYFAEQWERALKVDPEFIFVTGWNEWIAQRFIKEPGKGNGDFLGKRLSPGDTYFVDQYSQEFSRDVEPMSGGHGDNYYYQMAANIRRFKGVRAAGKPSSPKTLLADGSIGAWGDVLPSYRDDLFDTTPRNHRGYGDAGIYVNESGRNDFDLMKVARDSNNLYFYARTREPISTPAGENWMNLLIDIDGNPRTGWNGYKFLINRNRNGTEASIEKFAGSTTADWKWQVVGKAMLVISGSDLQLTVPRKLIDREPTKGPLKLQFKWTDNIPPGSALDFIDKGDTAPNGRFNYQYKE